MPHAQLPTKKCPLRSSSKFNFYLSSKKTIFDKIICLHQQSDCCPSSGQKKIITTQIYVHIQKPEDWRKTTSLVCIITSTYYASFSDGISFKSIRIIEKKSPAVIHTFEGLPFFAWISFSNINLLKVCNTFRWYKWF